MSETESKGSGVEARVRELVVELVDASPVYVVEVSLRGSRGSQILDVFVDSDEALDLDVLAGISKELRVLLEVEDLIDGVFKLNVSSPGLDRPLRLPRQFTKNVGRKVAVSSGDSDEPDLTEGILLHTGADEFEIETPDGHRTRFPKTDSVQVRVLPPW